MKRSIHKNNSRFVYGVFGTLVGVTVLSFISLANLKVSAASRTVTTTDGTPASVSAGASITVSAACTMEATPSAATNTMTGGSYKAAAGSITFTTTCNDPSGYALYAVGYTNDTEGNNVMKASNTLNSDIAAGTATSGNTSAWAMKATAVSGTYAPTIQNGFTIPKAIPTSFTKIAAYTAKTDATNGSGVTAQYSIYVAPTQGPGTYTGKVLYRLVHPNTATP